MPANKLEKQFIKTIFIFASVAAIFVMVLFSILLRYSFSHKVAETNEADSFAVNPNYNEGDPLLTKNPSLSDMLGGPIISTRDPNMGDREAKVTIVEYSDFACQFCQIQEQHLKELVAKNKYKVRLFWKDYPEDNEESESFQAAVAGRCAQAQDDFWRYHDLLYEFGTLDYATFIRIAEILDLNINDFKTCLDSEEAKKLVWENIEEANALKINGVPYIFINDKEFLGANTYEELEKVVKKELAQ